MKKVLNVIKYVFFLAIGIFVFWWGYRNYDMEKISTLASDIKWFWVGLSFFLGMFSHYIRALRWNLLINQLGYYPKVSNTFLSVLFMYFVNLVVPRGGEIGRCGVLGKYEKIPVSSLLGTVTVERISDFLALVVFAIIIVLSQLGVIGKFFENNPIDFSLISQNISDNLLLIVLIIIGIALLGLLIWYLARRFNFKDKLIEFKDNLVEGAQTILKLKRKGLYILYTVAIYFFWLIMMYVVFFAYKPTENLSIMAAMLSFVMGGLAMVVPVQGGFGVWHLMVAQTLVLYGITMEQGKDFALIAHTSTNFSLLFVGIISYFILVLKNPNDYKDQSILKKPD